jgi:uncharacterized repeat protein (TIGR01451 family)
MKQVNLLSLIIYGLIFTGLVSLNPILVAMALPLILYLMSGLLTVPETIDLRIERTISTERALPGTEVQITLKVTNLGPGLNAVLVEDILSPNLTVTNGSPRHLTSLKRGEQATWEYTLKGKRGYYPFASVQVETHDKLGLLSAHHTLATTGQLLILPQVLKLKRISIRPRKTRVYSGEIPARSGGLGVEFFGVRQYQPGDSPNWINWRASARHIDSLYSNEFEQERVSDVGIILDGRERSNTISTNTSIFEYSVLAAATLANAFLYQGDRVSLLHYGKYLEWTFPGYGKYQREKILRALTEVQPGHSLIFAYLQYIPTQIFPPQSQIVLISPLNEDDSEVLLQIRARGYRVLVISPDPVAFEKSSLPETPETRLATRILSVERQMMLQKIIQGGIRVVNWDVAQPFDQVVGTLSRFPSMSRAMENVQ